MTPKKINIAGLKRFDVTEFMDDKAAIEDFLNIAFEDGDPALIAATLGEIARARGMTQVAKDAGLSRESLYKGLSGLRVPSVDTLLKVIHALGLQLRVSAV